MKWLLSEAEYDEALWKKDSKVRGFNQTPDCQRTLPLLALLGHAGLS